MNPPPRPVAWNKHWPSVELPAPLEPRPEISHVLFDFDGTISLIRQGWPDVMVPMFVEALPRRPGETDDDIRRMVRRRHHAVERQADHLPDDPARREDPRARRPAGRPARLQTRIPAAARTRTSAAARPRSPAAPLRPTPCSSTRSGPCSSTCSPSDCRSISPAAPISPRSSARPSLLDVARYFGGHIYGALDDYKQFSKKIVIDRILQEHAITGRHLLSFGDGYVEIENTKQAGGLAVAVASDEANNGSGQVDEWKRERLLGVGADAVIPDFRDAIPFVDYLLGR